jgi:hypothetical protein
MLDCKHSWQMYVFERSNNLSNSQSTSYNLKLLAKNKLHVSQYQEHIKTIHNIFQSCIYTPNANLGWTLQNIKKSNQI